MSVLKKSTKSLIVGGVFLILPLLLIIMLGGKGVQILLPVGKKIVAYFHLSTLLGAAAVTVVCILLILLLCYAGGLLLAKGFGIKWSRSMEEKMFLVSPGLQMLKYRLLGDYPNPLYDRWEAVLLKDESAYNIAFITGRLEYGYLSIYIPDAPRMDAGEIRYVKESETDYLQISMKQAMDAINSFGAHISLKDVLREPGKG
jgi:hypothetical protein